MSASNFWGTSFFIAGFLTIFGKNQECYTTYIALLYFSIGLILLSIRWGKMIKGLILLFFYMIIVCLVYGDYKGAILFFVLWWLFIKID